MVLTIHTSRRSNLTQEPHSAMKITNTGYYNNIFQHHVQAIDSEQNKAI